MEMPWTRIELQEAFEEFMASNDGHVYFRPPESTKLKYPCIIYRVKSGDSQYANNRSYIFHISYDVQIIHKEADTDLRERFISRFPKCRFDTSFIVDNLNHENFVLYT